MITKPNYPSSLSIGRCYQNPHGNKSEESTNSLSFVSFDAEFHVLKRLINTSTSCYQSGTETKEPLVLGAFPGKLCHVCNAAASSAFSIRGS